MLTGDSLELTDLQSDLDLRRNISFMKLGDLVRRIFTLVVPGESDDAIGLDDEVFFDTHC